MKQKGQIGTPVESLIYGSRRLDITSGLLGFCCGVILVTAAVLTLVFIKAGRIEQTLKTDFAILLIVPLFSATVISACVELLIPKSKEVMSGYGRSPYQINTHHVDDVMNTRYPKYKKYYDEN